MAKARFIADGARVAMIKQDEKSDALATAAGSFVIEVFKTTDDLADLPEDEDLAAFALLTDEQVASSVARLLNAALMIGMEDLPSTSAAVEILLSQLLSDVSKSDPAQLMDAAIHYVFKQEKWDLDVAREEREDGIRFSIVNRNGPDLPHAVFMSTRGKTPAFWLMQDARIIQGTHAYKIPIQAATALKHELSDYIKLHDVGGLVRTVG